MNFDPDNGDSRPMNGNGNGKKWSGRAAIGFVAALSVVGWLSITAAVSLMFPGDGARTQVADEEATPEALENFSTAAGSDCVEDKSRTASTASASKAGNSSSCPDDPEKKSE